MYVMSQCIYQSRKQIDHIHRGGNACGQAGALIVMIMEHARRRIVIFLFVLIPTSQVELQHFRLAKYFVNTFDMY